MSKKRLAVLLGGAAIFAMGGIGGASADPVYGYAYLQLTNFALTSNGTLDVSTAIVTGQDGANYPGFPTAGTTTQGNITTGVDAPQAKSGPGPFPPENTFTQAMQASAGTRGDMLISGAIGGGGPQPTSSQTVAEGNLKAQGAAGSSAGSSTTVQISFTTSGGDINLVFTGREVLDASVAQLGDSATAKTSLSGNICNSNGSGCVLITDNNARPGDCAPAGFEAFGCAPHALNVNIGTNNPAFAPTYDSGLINYSFTASNLGAGTYTVTLNDQAQILLTSVPEPSSLALAGSALLGLVFFMNRRRRKHAMAA